MDGCRPAPSTARPAERRGQWLLALLAALLGVALAGPASAQAPAEPRVALVIGNAGCQDAPLRNPVRDARAMAAALRSLGFTVIVGRSSAERRRRAARTFP